MVEFETTEKLYTASERQDQLDVPKLLLTARELKYEPTDKQLIVLERPPHLLSTELLMVLMPLQLHTVPG